MDENYFKISLNINYIYLLLGKIIFINSAIKKQQIYNSNLKIYDAHRLYLRLYLAK